MGATETRLDLTSFVCCRVENEARRGRDRQTDSRVVIVGLGLLMC